MTSSFLFFFSRFCTAAGYEEHMVKQTRNLNSIQEFLLCLGGNSCGVDNHIMLSPTSCHPWTGILINMFLRVTAFLLIWTRPHNISCSRNTISK